MIGFQLGVKMKNKFLIIAIGIFLLFSFTALVSAANSDGLLQIWRNSTTGANVSTIDNNGNLYALGNLNLSGIYYGDGSGLTNLNVSAIDTSGLVPYTGSNKNIALGNYNFSIGTSELFVNSNTGNVGIGTATPGSKLDVVGAGKFSGAIYADATGSTGGVQLPVGWYFAGDGYTDGNAVISGSGTGSLYFTPWGTDGTRLTPSSGNFRIGGPGQTSSNLYVYGNVGIGTTTPTNKLQVSGTFNATSSGGTLQVDSNGNVKIGI